MTGRPVITQRTFTADRGDERLRLDQAIVRRLADEPGLSRARVQRWLKAGLVTVNSLVRRRASSALRLDDEVIVVLPTPRARVVHTGEDLVVPVLYEDDDLLVVNKPAGMVSHPTGRVQSGTLFNALLWKARGWNRAEARPGLVHRLDRDTSGVVLVAKSRAVHARAARLLRSSHAVKQYLAVVIGAPPASGTITLALAKVQQRPPRVGVVRDGGWPSLTRYTRVDAPSVLPGLSLLRCELGTGRLHQIRAHVLAAGWPVAGDPVYRLEAAYGTLTRDVRDRVDALCGQALHAWRLSLPHPVHGAPLTITAPIPPALQSLGVSSPW